MRVYVAVLSGQLLPNIIPILMNPPEQVMAIVSEGMQKAGKDQIFSDLLKQKGIPVTSIYDAPVVGYPDIREFAWKTAEQITQAYPDADIALNATGGTKLMTLAMVDAFRSVTSRIEYTDTGRRVIEIIPTNQNASYVSEVMTQVLDIPTYLATQGFRYLRAVSDAPDWLDAAALRKSVTKHLAQHVVELGGFIGVMNALAGKALSSDGAELAQPTQKLDASKPVPHGSWKQTLELLQKSDLIQWSAEDPYTITFPDVQAARFASGGWLEEYVWHTLRDDQLYDVRLGVEGTWKRSGDSRNEFDVLATHFNAMLYVECKTGFRSEENDSDLSYKTDSLGHGIRGLFGRTWVVSARKPSKNLLQRAELFGFQVIHPKEIPHLRHQVQQWARGQG